MNNDPIETTRLSPAERKRVLERMEREAAMQGQRRANRRRLRVRYPLDSLAVEVDHPGGGRVLYSVTPRNLSSFGLGFIHGTFLYPESLCRIRLVALDGAPVMINARVRHCRHVTGPVHEVAVVFDAPIDLRHFAPIAADQLHQLKAEQDELREAPEGAAGLVGGRQLTGKAVIVEDFEADRRLLSHWMQKLGLKTTELTDPANAVNYVVSEQPDLVSLDRRLGEHDGLALAEQIRRTGFAGPILLISSDTGDALEAEAIAAGCNAALPKPVNLAVLREKLEQFLTPYQCADGAPILSRFDGDEEMRPLIQQFVQTITDYAGQLRDALTENDGPTVRDLCRHIKGAGGAYGFDVLTETADTVLAEVEQASDELDTVRGSLTQLIRLLERARAA